MKLHVSITKDDIGEGTCGDARHCAGSMAINRAIRQQGEVAAAAISNEIEFEHVCWNKRQLIGSVEIPMVLGDFILEFDRRDHPIHQGFPEPLEFDLEIPDELWARIKGGQA